MSILYANCLGGTWWYTMNMFPRMNMFSEGLFQYIYIVHRSILECRHVETKKKPLCTTTYYLLYVYNQENISHEIFTQNYQEQSFCNNQYDQHNVYKPTLLFNLCIWYYQTNVLWLWTEIVDSENEQSQNHRRPTRKEILCIRTLGNVLWIFWLIIYSIVSGRSVTMFINKYSFVFWWNRAEKITFMRIHNQHDFLRMKTLLKLIIRSTVHFVLKASFEKCIQLFADLNSLILKLNELIINWVKVTWLSSTSVYTNFHARKIISSYIDYTLKQPNFNQNFNDYCNSNFENVITKMFLQIFDQVLIIKFQEKKTLFFT